MAELGACADAPDSLSRSESIGTGSSDGVVTPSVLLARSRRHGMAPSAPGFTRVWGTSCFTPQHFSWACATFSIRKACLAK